MYGLYAGVRVLYNSDLTFGKRLYGVLDVDLTRVKLHEPIDVIVQQPLLFVRDMVPRSCFLSLTKLDQVRCMSLLPRPLPPFFPLPPPPPSSPAPFSPASPSFCDG